MVLKKYPEAITRLTERIAGYEQDVQLAAAHPKPQEGFVGITILDQPYADKEAAGKAILDVCTKMTGSDAVFLGQYRGFSLVLSYDGPSNEYRMTMKGTLSHTAVLGADVFGNLTRMDNVIDGLSGKLEAVFFVKYFSLKKASKFPVFVKGFSLLLAGIDYASRRMRACSIR